MTRPSHEEIAAAVQREGAIYKAALVLGVHERTLRRWIKADPDLDARVGGTTRLGLVGGLKILAFDIETRPNLAYVWDLWNQNVYLDALVETTEVMCWAAKWVGLPEIEFSSEFHDGKQEMVQRIWELLNEADVVLHYNGAKFDVPHLNREFLLAGLTPPSPFKQIDLLKTAKRRFRFPSNKLAHVSEALGLAGKVKHEGFRLWLSCMAGDEAAWGRMREYNIQDVRLLEELYEKLRPWVVNHPSYSALYASDVCPSCGADELVEDGVVVLKTARYQRYRCGGCTAFSRSTRRIDGTTITEVAQ